MPRLLPLCLLALLAGCGQKGPLFLPAKAGPAVPAPAAPADATTEPDTDPRAPASPAAQP